MRSAFILTTTAILISGVAMPELIAARTKGYEPSAQYLSELGALGAPQADIMNFAGFLPTGVLWLIAVIQLWRASPKGVSPTVAAGLLSLTALSYLGAVAFPCDPGCPAEGSERQAAHNLLGFAGYVGAPPALVVLGLHYLRRGILALSVISLVTGAVFSLGFALMVGAEAAAGGALKGVWQRMADYSLFAWMAAAAALLSRPRLRA